MDEAQVILDFLFPPYQQAACAVRPGVCRLDDPSAGALALSSSALLFVATANVRPVAAAPRDRQRGFPKVSLVEAQMLQVMTARARPLQRNRTQRRLKKFLVVGVGPGDGNSQRDAAAVGEHRTLHAELTAIGRVFAGFFPRPAATSSSPRLQLASAKRFHNSRRTGVSTTSRIAAKCPTAPTPESTDARCWRRRTVVAELSTGSQFAANNKCRRPRPANSRAAAPLWDWRDTWATAAPTASTTSPASTQISRPNRNACTPPCY